MPSCLRASSRGCAEPTVSLLVVADVGVFVCESECESECECECVVVSLVCLSLCPETHNKVVENLKRFVPLSRRDTQTLGESVRLTQ